MDRHENTRTQDAEAHSRENSTKCENMVALICLIRPLARTAQKAAPRGGWCGHITQKLGRNCGNPGFKATSWQEVRQTKKLSVNHTEEPATLTNRGRKTPDMPNLGTAGEIQQLPGGQAGCRLVFMGPAGSLSCSCHGYGNGFFLTLTSRFSTVMQLKALKLSSSHDLESYQKCCSKCTAY